MDEILFRIIKFNRGRLVTADTIYSGDGQNLAFKRFGKGGILL